MPARIDRRADPPMQAYWIALGVTIGSFTANPGPELSARSTMHETMSDGSWLQSQRRKWRGLRELGVLGGSLFACSRVLSRLSGGRVRLFAYHLVAQPVRAERSLPARRGRAIKVREIGLEEALTLPVARPRCVLEDRFAQGARCLMASADGRFLGYLWFLVGPYEEDEVRCRFVPLPERQTAWDFDVFVEPSARLGFAFPRLWDEANQIFSSMGVRWSISRISVFNPGSLASHQRLGLARLASAVYLSAGRVQLMVASARPYVHLTWRASSRPVMQLSMH